MRVELRDGQWAELRERITHADDKDLKRAFRKGRKDDELQPDFETLVVRKYVRDWHVNDPDGNPIPLTDEDAIDRAPDDIVEQLVVAAGEIWTGMDLTPTPPSSDD
jgi:hypothetical protein